MSAVGLRLDDQHMAGGEIDIKHSPRRKHSSISCKSHKPHEKHGPASASVATSERPLALDVLRKARLKYLEHPSEGPRKRMKYIYDQPIPTNTRGERERDGQSTASLARRQPGAPRKRSKRKESDDRYAHSDDEYVYRRSREEKAERRSTSHSKSRSRDHLAPKATIKRPASSKAAVKRDLPRRNAEPPLLRTERRSSCPADDSTIIQVTPPAPRRRTTLADEPPRPSLRHSTTVPKAQTEVSLAKSSVIPPSRRKDSGLFSSLLLPKPSPTSEPKVPCLTCGSDDVPISKSARLPCKHRMCHTCLRRIFKMSITDPAHMPPRCCTDEHIDLKHVDKLFTQEFKRTWNRKFLEYKTKNKVYCIGKGCGEWIKPNHIMLEHGRKIGKCKRCGTRVCAICNNKAHTSRDCPKDPATKQFIETAKQKGWQKCYSCSAMVELKEGCNHMTCRCTAEFCMVCGVKWKGCDCPWFNYENVDVHLGNPVRYQEELDRRRDQEERDEALARRMQGLGIDGQGDDARREVFGIGNMAGHQMNANFMQAAREALTANYANAEQAARGLLNGWVTGRENRLPGFPAGVDEVAEVLRQGGDGGRERERERERARDPAEEARPMRRATNRRRSAIVDMFAGGTGGRSQTAEEAEEERRIQAWANGVS